MNRRALGRFGSRAVAALIATSMVCFTLCGCDRRDETSSTSKASTASAPSPAKPQPREAIELLFSYGSEKQKWVEDVTATFNAEAHTIGNGKTIHVTTVASGSGESKDDLLAGRVKAHLWSPASSVFVKLGNAESMVKGSPLVGPTKELVLSPVVIAMWKPMAEALGWPNKPVGWSDVIAMAKDPSGWAKYGRPEFGRFKFGHTHPEYSNSGLISILAEAYAGAGKVRDLSVDDVNSPKVADYVGDVERAVVHYGRSTGFFGRRLFEDGPTYLSAAVLYENMVIESYAQPMTVPLVAIYPKEGTIWSDHPVGIVQRDWVTDEHKQAAQAYIDFLRAPAQQKKALGYGFRPAEGELGAPLDAAHGVDPLEPKTILDLPSPEVTNATIELWRRNKKHSNVVLVFDRSGSMQEQQKMIHAKAGAIELVKMLGSEDELALEPFSSSVVSLPGAKMSDGRADTIDRINGLVPDGQTLLYEAVQTAYRKVSADTRSDRIRAIVVLTDGEDNGKRVTLEQLLKEISGGREGGTDVRIFTIGYGQSARLDDLKKIAKQARGEFYEGKPENIRNVFRDIATFF